MLSVLDIILVIWASWIIFNGARRGLISALVSLVSWTVGAIVAIRWHALLLPVLSAWIKSPAMQQVVALALVFFAVGLVLALLGWLATRTLNTLKLGWLNRVAGAALALAKVLIILSVLIHLLQPWLGTLQGWRQSVVIQTLKPYAKQISTLASQAARRVSQEAKRALHDTEQQPVADDRANSEQHRVETSSEQKRSNPFE